MKRLAVEKTECACLECQNACTNTPGWFRPGEAEKAAQLMGLSLRDFFTRYLGVNWWVAEEDVFVLAPALVGAEPGREYPANPRGTCVFFKDGRCEIHAAKPYDCAHGNPHEAFEGERMAAHRYQRQVTVRLWRRQQHQIETLLGRDPRADELSIFEAFGIGTEMFS